MFLYQNVFACILKSNCICFELIFEEQTDLLILNFGRLMIQANTKMEVEAPSNPVQQPNKEPVEGDNKIPELQQSTFTEEQESLYQNFMSKPFVFVPPPQFSDESLKLYRDNPHQFIKPHVGIYQVFDQQFQLSSCDAYLPKPQQESNESQNSPPETPPQTNKSVGIEIKVNNMKFLGYTIYTCMIEALKTFRDEDAMIEKLKKCNSTLKRYLDEFYKEANEVKEDYRRIEVIQYLEMQIQSLNHETCVIHDKIEELKDFAEKAYENKMNE